uniref:Uncharacterized protein n=1 Tax=Avena sativa TaxID=4498 RepID=A0ACD5Z2E7_AVESA
MAFLAGASSMRSPFALAFSSRRRYDLPMAVKATAANSNSVSPHPLISSLRLAASAAVLLAATSPAMACTHSPPPAPALSVTVSPEDAIQDDSYPFEKLIVETAAISRFGGADAARACLSTAGVGEHYARLLAAQALFVDGKVDEAIAAFEELAREDPGDYRPLFCQGVLYSVLGRVAESESMLERCQLIAGHKFSANFTVPVSEAEAEAEAVTEKTETEAQGKEDAEAEAESESVTENTETEAQGKKV